MKSKAESSHGGKREGAGRPPTVSGHKRTVYLSEMSEAQAVALALAHDPTIDPARAVSAGIRLALEMASKTKLPE